MKFDRRRKLAINSLVVKQSVSINGHHSSISIEGAFWNKIRRPRKNRMPGLKGDGASSQ